MITERWEIIMRRKVIIDTDPGIDDAVAIGLALFDETIEIVLMTTVSGNVSLAHTTNNILKLQRFWNKKIPVAMGAEQPILREAINASEVHGESGMDGYDFPEANHDLLLENNAVEAMYQALVASQEKLTIVAIGPLTNIGLLLRLHPTIVNKIEELIIMGGAINRGNVGVYSEFNIASDPEAARIVFTSTVPKVLVPLEIGHQSRIMPKESLLLKEMNQTGEMIHGLFQRYRGGSFETGIEMYDVCAIAYLLQREMFEVTSCFVGIEVAGTYTSGATIVDLANVLDAPSNCKVCVTINQNRFKEWFFAAVNRCSTSSESTH